MEFHYKIFANMCTGKKNNFPIKEIQGDRDTNPIAHCPMIYIDGFLNRDFCPLQIEDIRDCSQITPKDWMKFLKPIKR